MANDTGTGTGRRVPRTSPTGRGGSFRKLFDRRDGTSRVHGLVTGHAASFAIMVESALRAGCGILLAPTSDGGAISLTVFDGDDRQRTYLTNPEEVAEAVEVLQDLQSSRELGTEPIRTRT